MAAETAPWLLVIAALGGYLLGAIPFGLVLTRMAGLGDVRKIGSGNIGTDLMFKVIRLSQVLEMEVMAGIDPDSDGLARARRLGLETTHDGVDGLIASPRFDEIEIVFDATSASAHQRNAKKLLPLGKRLIDLTPAAPPPRHEHRASPPCRRVVPPAPRDSHRARPHARRATHASETCAL